MPAIKKKLIEKQDKVLKRLKKNQSIDMRRLALSNSKVTELDTFKYAL